MADDRYVLEIVIEDADAAARLNALDAAQDRLRVSGGTAATSMTALEGAMSKASMVGSAIGATIGNLAANALTSLVSNLGQSIEQVVDFSGELVDLSNKTGLSITALQELKFAGEQTGVSLEQITKAVTMMGRNLAGGKEGAVEAVQALGLSFTDLRAMSPEQAFYTIAEAVRGVEDPMAQAKIMNELFGRSGVELLPMINDQTTSLGTLKQAAHDLGVVISEDTIRASESLGDQWTVMETQGMALMAQLLEPLIPLAVTLANTLIAFAQTAMPYVKAGLDGLYAAFLAAKLGIADFLAGLLESVAKVPILGEKLGIVGDGAAYFRGMANDAKKALDEFGLSNDATSPKVQRMTLDLGDLDKSQQDASKAAAQHKAELDKLTGADTIAKGLELAANIKEAGVQQVIAAGSAGEYAKKLNEAVSIMDAQGKTVPAGMRELALELGMVATKTGDVTAAATLMGTKVAEVTTEADVLAGAYDLASTDISMAFATLPDSARTAGTNISKALIEEAETAKTASRAKWAEFGQGISSTILGAVMGGGNVGEAIGSFIGQGIGSKLNDTVQGLLGGVSGALGGVLSGAANAILPGFGTLLGGALSSLFDGIFKGEERKVNDLRDGFIANAGGLTALNEEAAKAGVTLDKLLDAKKTKDFEAAQKELTKAIEAHKEALAKLDTALTETFTKGMTLTDQLAADMLTLFQRDPEAAGQSIFKFLQGEIGNVTSGFNTAATAWSETLTGGEAGFQRFGIAAVAAFEAAKEAGASVPEALAAIKPGLEALIQGMENLGTGGGTGNAAFDQLLSIATMSEQFQPLLDQVSGLSTMITSLGNVGLLTQETFSALADQVGEAFTAMTSQGASAEDAMRLIQPQLQKLWEAENQFGVETRGATADLLDQAFQSGIVGTQFSSAQDRMIESVNRLVGRMSDLITVMTGGTVSSMVGGAQWASTAVNNALDDVTTGPARGEVTALGGALKDHLPWTAAVGKEGVNAQLGGVSISRPVGEVVALGTTLREHLPWSAGVGVGGINTAFGGIDVGGVQDAVHDIDWEFEQGIPDAADSGVDLVNSTMDTAEDAIGEVRDASRDVATTMRTDIPAATDVAGGAIYDFAQDAVDYLGNIEDAAAAAAWGQSPTGIKEIPIALAEARAAMRMFERDSLASLRAVERAAPLVTFDVGGTTDTVPPLRGLGVAPLSGGSRDEQAALAGLLADAVVAGFARSGLTVDVEGRTFGRLVAEHGPRGIRRSSATRR